MTVLLFKPRFVDPILSGVKRQTIRTEWRKNPIAPGATLSLRAWSGTPYRSPQREIVPPVVCHSVRPIGITVDARKNTIRVQFGRVELHPDDVPAFVRNDGFSCVSDMADYYDAAGVKWFDGVLIQWDYPEVPS